MLQMTRTERLIYTFWLQLRNITKTAIWTREMPAPTPAHVTGRAWAKSRVKSIDKVSMLVAFEREKEGLW